MIYNIEYLRHSFLSKKHELIFKEKQLITWLEKIKKSSIISLYIETDFSDCFSSKSLIGFAFSIEPDVSAYIPISKSYFNVSETLTCKVALTLLKPILESDKYRKIGQNLKYMHRVLLHYGIELKGIDFDITIASYMLNSVINHYNLSDLIEKWLKHKKVLHEKDIKIEKVSLNDHLKIKEKGQYFAENASCILQLYFRMWKKLKKHTFLSDIFKNIEIPLISVLSRMENNGILIDQTILQKQSKKIKQQLEEIKVKAYTIAGEKFNIASVKEVRKILFEKQNIRSKKRTPGGVLSTSEEILEELSIFYPLPKLILEYRELTKLKSNYIDKLLSMINLETGRIHTSYYQAVTTTGRLSSAKPNLQNIPVHSKAGKCIRQAFIAPKDFLIISADYSQIELRILAHFSKDQNLLTAFFDGKDIHAITAAKIFGIPEIQVNSQQRYHAKIVNFGLIYGMNAFSLSRKLQISYQESKKLLDLYFNRYPKILDYINFIQKNAKKNGYVETLIGRRLYLPDIRSSNNIYRSKAERAAINAPVQGTAADIIKKAMIAIDTWIEKEKPRVRMILQIHDELIFEVYYQDIDNISRKIRKFMENSVHLDVPLPVKIKIGKNWGQMH